MDEPVKRVVVNYIFSTQVGEDSWRVVSSYKVCEPGTTLGEVIKWTKTKRVTTAVRIEIAEED